MDAALTRVRKGLRERLQALCADRGLWEGFAKGWAEECNKDPFADPESLFADCPQQGERDPLDLLQCLLNATPRLTTAGPDASLAAKRLREATIGLCLFSCERFILRRVRRCWRSHSA